MKVTVKGRIIRSIDIQISMTHYIPPMNNERYIYQSKIILLSVWYVCACVFPHVHLLVKSKEQVRQCVISRGRCFSFVRTITSRKFMHAHRKKRSWKLQSCCGVSERVVPHTCSAHRQVKRERNVGPRFHKLHIPLQLHNSSIL